MMNNLLVIIGAVVITIWGIAHIVPTKSVIAGFGPISENNRRIITMGWIAEGITLCFIGLLSLFIAGTAGADNPIAQNVFRASGLMLIVMALLTGFTGARTSILPIKLCPAVKAIVAILFFLGTYL